MAATRLGEVSPIDSIVYSDDLEGGASGAFSELWYSTLTDPDGAMAEIIAALEGAPYNRKLGAKFTDPPFSKTTITGRSVKRASSDDQHAWVVTYELGPRKVSTLAATADWVYTFSSTVSAAETNVDADDTFITVGTLTTGDPTPTSGPPYTAVPKTGAQVEKMFPSVRITASGKMATNPFASFQDKVGTLNSGALTLGGQSLAIGTTMLIGAEVQTPNDGEYYVVNYQFEYRKDPLDWYAVVVAIDPKTGKPYQGISGTYYNNGTTKGTITVPSGSVGYKIYKETDLQSLITIV